MAGYVEGADRSQATLFPDRLDDFVGADNPVRVVDAFVEALDLGELGFTRAAPASTGRPGYDPAVLNVRGLPESVHEQGIVDASLSYDEEVLSDIVNRTRCSMPDEALAAAYGMSED
jgi:hypothetical protein